MRFDVTAAIDLPRRTAQARSDALYTHAARQWHTLYKPFIPIDTGRLANDVRIAPGLIEHRAPYSGAVYAKRPWDKAAMPAQLPALIRSVQAFVDRGGLRLDS